MKKIFFILSFAVQSWALSCSDPVVISPLYYPQLPDSFLLSNHGGKSALFWEDLLENGNEIICMATKDENGWSDAENILEDERVLFSSCQIASDGTIFVYWKDEREVLHGMKNQNGNWSEPVQLFDQNELEEAGITLVSIIPNGEGKFQYIRHKKMTAPSFNWRDDPEFLQFVERSLDTSEEKIQEFKTSLAYSRVLAFGSNTKGEQYFFWNHERKEYDGKTEFSGLCRHKDGTWGGIESYTFPAIVSAEDEFKVAVDSQGNVVIVFNDYDDLYAITRSCEGKWSEPTVLASFEEEYLDDLQLLPDSQGNFLAVWRVGRNKQSTLYSAYLPRGGNWSLPMQLTLDNQVGRMPQLQLDPSGQFVLLWQNITGLKYLSIYGATFSVGKGEWSTIAQISPDGNYLLSYFAITPQGEKCVNWINANDCYHPQLETAVLSID